MAAIILKPLPDGVIVDLFQQAIVGRRPGDPYINGLRELTRLIEAELQGQIYAAAHRLESGAKRRARDRARKGGGLADEGA